MMIGLNEMEIEEISLKHQLQTNILYFIAPQQDFPSLVRSSTFTNLDPNNDLEIEILDGLAQIIPNGNLTLFFLFYICSCYDNFFVNQLSYF